jgi:hypothetical protein
MHTAHIIKGVFMFKIPRVNVIESDDGFSVEILGRVGILYTEGEKSIHIDSEVLASESIAISKSSIKSWNPPHNNDIIDEKKRDLIIENIRKALLFKGIGIYT